MKALPIGQAAPQFRNKARLAASKGDASLFRASPSARRVCPGHLARSWVTKPATDSSPEFAATRPTRPRTKAAPEEFAHLHCQLPLVDANSAGAYVPPRCCEIHGRWHSSTQQYACLQATASRHLCSQPYAERSGEGARIPRETPSLSLCAPQPLGMLGWAQPAETATRRSLAPSVCGATLPDKPPTMARVTSPNLCRPQATYRPSRLPTLVLQAWVTLSTLVVHVGAAHAQEAWLLVPVFESHDSSGAPIAALVHPWERALSRSVKNSAAAEILEKRHSVAAQELAIDRREHAEVSIDKALHQLALGNLDAGAQALRSVTELPPHALDVLLHTNSIAQKLFDACTMRAYILARQSRELEAKQELRACAKSYPDYPNEPRAFAPQVHGPPQLKTSFRLVTEEVSRERTGTLSLSSTVSGCTAFVNGLLVGEAPVRLSPAPVGPARVQLSCDGKLSRSHHVLGDHGTDNLEIDPRFDANLGTTKHLQLRYESPARREAFLAHDAMTVRQALGVDRLALLLVRPQGNAWAVHVHVFDAATRSTRSLGELAFSEAASYDPSRLQRMVKALSKPENNGQARQPRLAAPITLTAPVPATNTEPAAPPDEAQTIGWSLPIGIATAAIGGVGIATGWLLFAERRDFRLREWPSIQRNDETAYARRGTWTVAATALGAGALAASTYFWLPKAEPIPAFAWVIGGVGLATAAVGVTMVFTDEHCGPETVLPLREPCRSVRADSLLGVEIALSALPLMTLPLSYLLRASANTSVAVHGHGGGITLSISGQL